MDVIGQVETCLCLWSPVYPQREVGMIPMTLLLNLEFSSCQLTQHSQSSLGEGLAYGKRTTTWIWFFTKCNGYIFSIFSWLKIKNCFFTVWANFFPLVKALTDWKLGVRNPRVARMPVGTLVFGFKSITYAGPAYFPRKEHWRDPKYTEVNQLGL